MVPAVVTILEQSPTPVRRRKLLEELERKGHRISLAGLNRVLQYCSESGLTEEGPEGARLRR
jgi:Fe2+ or Zn2+ uptake regulation protein